MRLDVALLPDRVDRGVLSAAAVLVVDVLRASTTMIAALGNGCAGIVPVSDPDEAHRRPAPSERGARRWGTKGLMIEASTWGTRRWR